MAIYYPADNWFQHPCLAKDIIRHLFRNAAFSESGFLLDLSPFVLIHECTPIVRLDSTQYLPFNIFNRFIGPTWRKGMNGIDGGGGGGWWMGKMTPRLWILTTYVVCSENNCVHSINKENEWIDQNFKKNGND